MGLTANIATAIASTVASASGMRGCASQDPDSIPGTPYGAVGLPKVSLSPGSWENVDYVWPVRIYIAKVSDGPRTVSLAYDLWDALVTAFRTGIQEGLAASGVAQTIIDSGNFDAFYTVAGEDYQAIDLEVTTTVARGVTYTA